MLSVLSHNAAWLQYGGAVLTYDPYNPLGLPPFTMRFMFSDPAYDPTTSGVSWKTGSTWTMVSSSPNIWDYTHANNDWSWAFQDAYPRSSGNEVTVLGANTSLVTNMIGLFQHPGSGDTDTSGNIIAVNLFDTSSISSTYLMFAGNTKITSIPNFPIGSVTDMRSMFFSCIRLTDVPLFDTHSVTNMANAFNYCASLTQVPLFDTSSVTNMKGLFARCQSLTAVPLFDTSSVLLMGSDYNDAQPENMGMFEDSGITSIPAFDTSSVTSLQQFCRGCTSLTTVPLLNTSSVVRMDNAFNGCYYVTSGALALYNQVSSQAVPPTYHYGTFASCGNLTTTGAAELAQIPSDWK